MKYSVIIPVYNAENTIERCLDSLLSQPHASTEIILVNDGSIDRSAEICKDYAEKNSCIVYLEQENAGASAARNAGLRIASGEYITFVDSDDYVEDTYFSELEKDDSDFIVYAYRAIRSKNVFTYKFDCELLQKAGHTDVVLGVIQRRIAGPCNKRFKNAIIKQNNIAFKHDLVIGEDFIFGLEYMLACQTSNINTVCIYFIDETSADSITRGAKYDFSQFILMYTYAFRIAETCHWNEVDKQRLLQTLDYLYCRTAFACMERCIGTAPKAQITPKSVAQMFYDHRHTHIKSLNVIHAVMRFCVNYRLLFILQFVAYLHQLLRHCR